MIKRVLEPEVMDTEEDANEYAAFNHSIVNHEFVAQALALAPKTGQIIDIGTGPADISILLAQQCTTVNIIAIDLGEYMLRMARENVIKAQLSSRVEVHCVDAKATGFDNSSFDMAICNSLVHHIPEPFLLFKEIQRILKPHAAIFIKDLHRPDTEDELSCLVETYSKGCSQYQKKIFEDSLRASLTVEEVKNICSTVGLTNIKIEKCSDRHWSVARQFTV